MSPFLLFVAMPKAWLLASAVPAHGAAAAEAGGHGGDDTGSVVMHHVVDAAFWGIHSKFLVFFVIAALLVILITQLARRGYRKGGVPTGMAAVVEMLVLFIRDDIACKNIGHDGRKYTPLLCSFFFFILVAALLGLVPFPNRQEGHWAWVSATSTGSLSVTAALAAVSFLAQQYAGMSKYGIIGHLRNLVPPGLPLWLLPVMVPVEILGMFTKPFALMIRLFANMLAGHMVITTLLLLIPLMAKVATVLGIFIIPVSLGLSLFIMALEVLVAFIQAYIFTLLTSIFIGMYAHPAH